MFSSSRMLWRILNEITKPPNHTKTNQLEKSSSVFLAHISVFYDFTRKCVGLVNRLTSTYFCFVLLYLVWFGVIGRVCPHSKCYIDIRTTTPRSDLQQTTNNNVESIGCFVSNRKKIENLEVNLEYRVEEKVRVLKSYRKSAFSRRSFRGIHVFYTDTEAILPDAK